MAVQISSITITPATVDVGAQFIVSVDAIFTLNFNELENATWDSVDLNIWDDLDDTAVHWYNYSRVTLNSTQIGKTNSLAEGWDAGAISKQAITSGDGFVEATVLNVGKPAMIGLSFGDTDKNYTDIDFAAYITWNSGTPYNFNVYEKGVDKGVYGKYYAGDRIKVAVEGGVVKYYVNDDLRYTSAQAITYPLLVDTSFYSPGMVFDNVRLVK